MDGLGREGITSGACGLARTLIGIASCEGRVGGSGSRRDGTTVGTLETGGGSVSGFFAGVAARIGPGAMLGGFSR